ncbi:hypothetical protein LJ739_14995 [Aestuariibacter halophilus]|uniref:Lipoprotein n=1 Tax=Fluctibacter halophilus TaxID=226011 RepID=A0ABS8GAL3_9ALTE|nr:hypothetical protein [Aestuariibacter halophilus]MCC2617558.1 hypothetical protein [Aestuariibacter halophilus]
MKTRTIIIAALLLSMLGCASVPLRTMYHLSQFDPMQADPGQIAVAIRTTDAIAMQKGDVTIDLAFAADDNSVVIDNHYLVEVAELQRWPASLQDGLQAGEGLTVLHLSEQDAQSMREVQKMVLERREQLGSAKGKGSFSVSVKGTCLRKALPQGDVYVDLLLQVDTEQGFLTLAEDATLAELLEQGGEATQRTWPQCESS